ncbi:hypothetical protein [Rhodococcus sp. DMU1]|uniref:hypothetical protein n=1 Tax=Rhodococcus sp. DMU1 TaxID=2722825 RepID=UPI00143E2671|nr:hypothetical protein [Rhodococcus sp. DMU1]QIX53912.1 hypothetical protein HFP48_30625 [Rhodococcus sp. DMU1]
MFVRDDPANRKAQRSSSAIASATASSAERQRMPRVSRPRVAALHGSSSTSAAGEIAVFIAPKGSQLLDRIFDVCARPEPVTAADLQSEVLAGNGVSKHNNPGTSAPTSLQLRYRSHVLCESSGPAEGARLDVRRLAHSGAEIDPNLFALVECPADADTPGYDAVVVVWPARLTDLETALVRSDPDFADLPPLEDATTWVLVGVATFVLSQVPSGALDREVEAINNFASTEKFDRMIDHHAAVSDFVDARRRILTGATT